MMIVTTRHMLTIPGYTARGGFCRTGGHRWADSHGLDWHDFVKNGIDSDKLRATDAFGIALADWAEKCEAAEQAAREQADHG